MLNRHHSQSFVQGLRPNTVYTMLFTVNLFAMMKRSKGPDVVIPVVTVPSRLRQETEQLKARLGYMVRQCL